MNKVAWFIFFQDPSSGSYQRIRKLMEDVDSLIDATFMECVLARIPLSIGDILRIVKSKPILKRHKRLVFPVLLPGGRFGMVRTINRFTQACCGHIVGFMHRPHLVIGEYASVWPSVEPCARYRENAVSWIDIHGAEPEETEYTHPELKNIHSIIDDMRRTEKQAIDGADILTVQSDVMTTHLASIHGIQVTATSYQCGVDTSLFVSDPELRQYTRKQLGYLPEDCVLVYAGGTAKWQLLPQTFSLIASLHAMDQRCKGLILTCGNHDQIREFAKASGLENSAFRLMSAAHHEVSKFLSAADIGILLRVDNVVNRVACPTKLGEYLACGLPVIAGPVAWHWPWFTTAGIFHIVKNVDNIEGQATETLSFVHNALAKRSLLCNLCRQVAESRLSRTRDRVELKQHVIPVIRNIIM